MKDLEDEERYARQSAVPGFAHAHEILMGKKIGIIGLGGLGALTSRLLVGAGALKLKLADLDAVSLSNLHRQVMYEMPDLGELKAQKLKERLIKTDPRAQIKLYARVDASNFADFAEGLDLILDLTDNQKGRLEIAECALAAQKAFLSASVSVTFGQITLLRFDKRGFVKEHGCYRCLSSTLKASAQAGPAVLGPAASAMASLTALEVMKYFTGLSDLEGKVRFVDFMTMKSMTAALHADPACSCRQLAVKQSEDQEQVNAEDQGSF